MRKTVTLPDVPPIPSFPFKGGRRSTYKRKGTVVAVLLLAAGLGVYFSLYQQGIPCESDGILGAWVTTKEVSWPRMAGYLFNPVTEQRTAGHFLSIINVRVTESIVYKALYDLFGDDLRPATLYVILTGVVFSLAVFGLIRWATGSTLAGFLCAAFLAATPAYGWCVMEHGDHSPSDQILLIAYLALFLPLIARIPSKPFANSVPAGIAKFAWLWIVGMIAVRAKEPIRYLLPLISWAMLLWVVLRGRLQGDWGNRLRAATPLILLTILLTLPAMLTRVTSSRAIFLWKNLLNPFYMLLWNPKGWQAEPTSALLTLKPMFPVSVASTLGFFLSWGLVLAAIAYIAGKGRKNPAIQSEIPWGYVFSVWLAGTLVLAMTFGFLGMTRYLSIPLLPFCLLATWIFVRMIASFDAPACKVLAGALIFLVGIKTAENLKHSVYLRQELEGLWTPKWMIREAVYQDATGDEHPSLFKVYSYLGRSDGIPYPAGLVTYIWHHQERKDLPQDEKFKTLLWEHKVAYVGSKVPLQLPWRSELMRKIDGSRLSMLTSWYYRFTEKPRPTFYLYKVWS